MIYPIAKKWKILGWIFLFLMDMGMLFYIFLFSLQQNSHRQSAWGRSLGFYLFLDIVFISSFTVLFMHVLLPKFLMKDVGAIQKKMSESISKYLENLHNNPTGNPTDKNSTENEEDQEEEDDAPLHVPSGATFISEKKSNTAIQSLTVVPFNAAKYLFLSYHVAGQFPDLPASQIILSYSSPWPKQSYLHSTNAKNEYSQTFTAVSRASTIIVTFFLTNLLATPIAIQDMIMQMIATLAVGYTLLVHVQLYDILPALVIVPTLLLISLVLLVRRIFFSSKEQPQTSAEDDSLAADEPKRSSSIRKISSVSPQRLPSNATDDKQPQVPPAMLPTRRQSLQMGLQISSQLKQQLAHHHPSSSSSHSDDPHPPATALVPLSAPEPIREDEEEHEADREEEQANADHFVDEEDDDGESFRLSEMSWDSELYDDLLDEEEDAPLSSSRHSFVFQASPGQTLRKRTLSKGTPTQTDRKKLSVVETQQSQPITQSLGQG